MAEETQQDQATTEEQKPKKGGGAMKAIIIVVVVMVIEAVAFLGMMMMSGPDAAEAADVVPDEQAELDKPVEVLVVEGKFDNQRTGRTYLYDTKIVVLVSQRHAEQFQADVEASQTQVSVDIQTIFRRAEPAHFQEPTRATLTRQVKAKLDERFGTDAEDQPIIDEVLIAKCLAIRMDY